MEQQFCNRSRRDVITAMFGLVGTALLSGCCSNQVRNSSRDTSDPVCAGSKSGGQVPSFDESLVSIGTAIRVYSNAATPNEMWKDVFDESGISALRTLIPKMDELAFRDGVEEKLRGFSAYLLFILLYHRRRPETDYFASLCPELISSWKMAVLQRQYTLSHLFCTTTSTWDEQRKSMVMMRSLDWPLSPYLGYATRKFEFTGVGSTAAVAGVLGMAGVLTAVRHGYSVAINYAPGKCSAKLMSDPTFLLRDLIENPKVDSFERAREEVKKWNVGAPCFVSLCGINFGEACVIEFGPDSQNPHVRNAVDGVIVQTNHYDPVGPFCRYNPPQVEVPTDRDLHYTRLLFTSVLRRETVELAIGNASNAKQELFDAYRKPPVWNNETAQVAFMEPVTGQMELFARRILKI